MTVPDYIRTPLILAALFGLGLASGAGAETKANPKVTIAAGPASEPPDAIFVRACQSCHDLTVASKPHTASEWPAILQRMRSHGADLTDEEVKTLQTHVINTYAK